MLNARRRLASGRTDGGIVAQNNFSRDEDCCSLSTTTWSAPLQRPAGAVLGCSPSLHVGAMVALAGNSARQYW
jgi:hypothetical protein